MSWDTSDRKIKPILIIISTQVVSPKFKKEIMGLFLIYWDIRHETWDHYQYKCTCTCPSQVSNIFETWDVRRKTDKCIQLVSGLLSYVSRNEIQPLWIYYIYRYLPKNSIFPWCFNLTYSIIFRRLRSPMPECDSVIFFNISWFWYNKSGRFLNRLVSKNHYMLLFCLFSQSTGKPGAVEFMANWPEQTW